MKTEFLAVYTDKSGCLQPESFLGNFDSKDQATPAFIECKKRMIAANENTAKHWQKIHGDNWYQSWLNHGLQPMQEKVDTLRILSYPDYILEQNKIFEARPFEEITADRYMDLLEVLPPVKWSGIGSCFETFFMLEKYSGEWRDQVIKCRINNEWRYFKKLATVDNPITFDQLKEALL